MCDLETRISGCALETWIPVWYLETRIFVWGLETRIPVCGLETGNSVGYLETKNFQVFQPSKFFLRNNGLLCANEHRSRFVSFYHFFCCIRVVCPKATQLYRKISGEIVLSSECVFSFGNVADQQTYPFLWHITRKHPHRNGPTLASAGPGTGLFRNLAGEAMAPFFFWFSVLFLTLLKRMNAVQFFFCNVFSIFFEKMGYRGPARVYKNHI